MFKLRPYQKDIISRGSEKLVRLRIIMLALEVRCGKTIVSLSIAQKVNAKKVLFITKKKIILSNTIHNDYNLVNPDYEIEIVNYESLHKLENKDYDLYIIDESHSISAYPKPSVRTKAIKSLVKEKMVILLTGSPTPESFSQIYHQFWISDFSPFKETSFYKWAKMYVSVEKRYIAYGNVVNDYSNANEKLIREACSDYILSFSQKQAGFKTSVKEEILLVDMKPSTYELANLVKRNLVYRGVKGGVILADTPVKLMQKCHQIYSGTCKLEDGSYSLLDNSKAVFIRNKFKGKKIAIFYKFKAELELLKETFKSEITTCLKEFNSSKKNIALQIVSGREGISLKQADHIVYLNIDFSATSYFQSKDRMTTKDRAVNKVYWVFSKGGIEQKIYKAVMDKKNYTLSHFKRDERQYIHAKITR